MHDAVLTLIKAMAGGTLVVAFSLLGEALRPKWLAGLFSAALSVAIAGLLVTIADTGDRTASREALGMIFGAVAFVAFSACVRPLLDRHGAAMASLIGCGAWAVVGVGGYLGVIR